MWLGVRGEVVQQHKQAMEAALEHEAAVKELGTTYEEAVVNAAFDEPLETNFDIVDAMLQFDEGLCEEMGVEFDLEH